MSIYTTAEGRAAQGKRPYREYPLEWVQRRIGQAPGVRALGSHVAKKTYDLKKILRGTLRTLQAWPPLADMLSTNFNARLDQMAIHTVNCDVYYAIAARMDPG